MAKDSHRVMANIIVLFVKQMITWSLTTVLILFVPRYLGDDGLGQVTFAASFTGLLVPLIFLGVPTYLIKEVARDKSKLGSYFFNSLAMRVPLSALVFLIVFVSVNLMGYPPQTKAVVYVGCLTTILMCLSDTASSILQGIEDMRWLSVAEVVGKAVVTGAGILVLVSGGGVFAYAVVLLLGMGTTLVINVSYFVFKAKIKPTLDFRVWRTLLVGGLPFLLTGVLATVYQRIDATILGLTTTDAVVGWYGAATQLMGSIHFAPILIGTAMMPALARMHKSDPGRIIVASRKCLSIIIAVSWPMAVGTILISDKMIEFLRFPEAFQNSVPLMAILSVNLPLTGMLVVVGTVVQAADRQRQWAKVTAIGVVFNVSLNLVGIPIAQGLFANGAIGAAAASVVSEAIIMVLAFRLLPKGILDGSIFRVFVKSLAGASAMGAVIWSIHSLDIIPVVVSGMVVYGLFSLLVKSFEIEDLTLVRDVILKRRLAVA